jgi:hypothetical protein
MHRFIDPAGVKIDANTPRKILEKRAQLIISLVLRALASGRL